MRWLRLLNIARTIRLDREIGAMHEQIAAMKRATLQYIDVGGRQLSPTSTQGVLRRAILAENDNSVLRMGILAALRDLRRGRHDLAASELEALIGEEPAKTELLHVVDFVA